MLLQPASDCQEQTALTCATQLRPCNSQSGPVDQTAYNSALVTRACKLIRKMRGGSQSHLVQAEDDHFYVLKTTRNGQHRRVLINEWLSAAILRHLGILVPDTAIIHVTDEFLAENSDLYISRHHQQSVPAGFHFGSRLSVNPETTAIFDFLTDKMLGQLPNRLDFIGTLVFDKWAFNCDSRQAIFFRAKLPGRKMGFWAQMIDHGFTLGGPTWCFDDLPKYGFYFRPCVYDPILSLDSLAPWLEAVRSFPDHILATARRQLPPEWVDGDEEALERTLNVLMERRSRVDLIINKCRAAYPEPFRNWRRMS